MARGSGTRKGWGINMTKEDTDKEDDSGTGGALPLAWLCGTVRAEVMQHEVLLQARRKGRSAGGF